MKEINNYLNVEANKGTTTVRSSKKLKKRGSVGGGGKPTTIVKKRSSAQDKQPGVNSLERSTRSTSTKNDDSSTKSSDTLK